MTPEQLEQLRLGLPALADNLPASPLLQAFCQFYQIDYGAYAGLEHRAGTIASGDFSLMVHQWLQPSATRNLLVVHGYFDHTGLFGKLIDYGLSRNCNVLCFDLPGHGLSSGEPAVIDDFRHYSQAIADVLAAARWPDLPRWTIAQSTGCAALMDYARHYPWPFSHTVLLAPLVRPAGWHRIRLGNQLLRPFVDSIARSFNENSSDREFLVAIEQDPLQARRVSMRWVGALRTWLAELPADDLKVGPALILQGDEDGTVDWRYNVPFVSRLFPGSHVEYLPRAGHQLANESVEIRDKYMQTIDGYLGFAATGGGSGRDQSGAGG